MNRRGDYMSCVVKKLPTQVLEATRGFVNSIPQEWRVGMFGEFPAPIPQHHITFLTHIQQSKEQELLRALEVECPISEVVFQAPFISSVDRIKGKAKVYCVGLSVVSPTFREMRERVAHKIDGNLRYGGDGHVSVCYFEEKYLESMQEMLNSTTNQAAIALKSVNGIKFTIDELQLKRSRDSSQEITLPIGKRS